MDLTTMAVSALGGAGIVGTIWRMISNSGKLTSIQTNSGSLLTDLRSLAARVTDSEQKIHDMIKELRDKKLISDAPVVIEQPPAIDKEALARDIADRAAQLFRASLSNQVQLPPPAG